MALRHPSPPKALPCWIWLRLTISFITLHGMMVWIMKVFSVWAHHHGFCLSVNCYTFNHAEWICLNPTFAILPPEEVPAMVLEEGQVLLLSPPHLFTHANPLPSIEHCLFQFSPIPIQQVLLHDGGLTDISSLSILGPPPVNLPLTVCPDHFSAFSDIQADNNYFSRNYFPLGQSSLQSLASFGSTVPYYNPPAHAALIAHVTGGPVSSPVALFGSNAAQGTPTSLALGGIVHFPPFDISADSRDTVSHLLSPWADMVDPPQGMSSTVAPPASSIHPCLAS